MDGGAWWAKVHGVAKSQTRLSDFTFTFHCPHQGFPGGSEGKASACNEGDQGLIPGLGRSPGEGNGNLLQYSCQGNPKEKGTCWATVQSQIQLSDYSKCVPTGKYFSLCI